jgi:ABC-type polar amino acid transport system ATPase subunit
LEDEGGMSGAMRLNQVCLWRGERQILGGIDFEVGRGELVALMGPSGAGKSTVLRVITALETFHSGTVQVDELLLRCGPQPAASIRKLRAKIGMVFQSHHLFEHLPVLKNVCLAPVHARGVPPREAERRGRELLERLGVAHRAAALPRELSGGEAQRVAIARALAMDPQLLLLDEPTASLDAARRGELAELLRGLAAQGRTLLFATHDEEFARACAMRVLRLNEGKVTEEPLG